MNETLVSKATLLTNVPWVNAWASNSENPSPPRFAACVVSVLFLNDSEYGFLSIAFTLKAHINNDIPLPS